jgi:hypothetical protein
MQRDDQRIDECIEVDSAKKNDRAQLSILIYEQSLSAGKFH